MKSKLLALFLVLATSGCSTITYKVVPPTPDTGGIGAITETKF